MVSCTTTDGFKLLLGMEYSFSSGWVKTHRSCIANGSSRLDLAESSLAYTANLTAVQSCRLAAGPTLLAAKHEASSRIDCSGYLCFLCKSTQGLLSSCYSHFIRHSKDSTSASTATLSPVEHQGGFGHLSTINEHTPRAGDALSASTDSMQEKDSPTQPPHSWLTNFLVGAHLSAPNRHREASSTGGQMPHVGSNSNHQSDSTVEKDYA